jgi:hypothetical protein
MDTDALLATLVADGEFGHREQAALKQLVYHEAMPRGSIL